MKDTSADVEALVAARAIVESSLPAHLSRRERRLTFAVRLYGQELPQAALEAFAAHE